MSEEQLPELPEPDWKEAYALPGMPVAQRWFGQEKMREYARAAVRMERERNLSIMEAVWREMDEGDGENAPGHAHSRPGIWDDDNKPGIAGKPCAWCLTWNKFTGLINRDRTAWNAKMAQG